MESGNDKTSTKGVLVPVSTSCDAFQSHILRPLKSAYLYEESKQSFRYESAVLVQNPALEKQYDAFRTKRREEGYSEEDLEESYGFLLFDDVNKANELGENGVLVGNSTCTTLGDPSNGVYISRYSDCLDQNCWYYGKSGYIAIIRLTKGKVKQILENYTQNLTPPTEGFDCHVSEELPSVSAKTSSFLAFERTQYYMYELLDDGSNETARSPSAVCPFAIVSFSYSDTKATLVTPQEKSEEKKLVRHYFLWRGQLQIGTHVCNVGLTSTSGTLLPTELPQVVKVDRAITMLELRQLLPRSVFETCFSGEVFLDGLYCCLCEFVSSEADQTSSLSLLLREIKEKDFALIVPLDDGGFLILLHSSHFLTYDDTGSSASEVLQGLFAFPDSRLIHRDTKCGQRKPAMSSEILRVLPVLSYAEGEVERTPTNPNEELCDVFVKHMQNYAAMINPGLASSPSRDLNIFPEVYDVPDAHKHLYTSPEWTNGSWQNLTSYLSKPESFQLPVSKASEILATGQEEQIEDLDEDIYFCLSSPEEVPDHQVSTGSEDQWTDHQVSTGSEDQWTDQKSALDVEKSMNGKCAEAQVVPRNVVPDDLQRGDDSKDTERSDQTLPIKTDDTGSKTLLTPSTSNELPAELIVSIISATQTVTDARLGVSGVESATKHNDFQLSALSTPKLQTSSANSLDDETVTKENVVEYPELTNLTKARWRTPHKGHSKDQKHIPKAYVETPTLQGVKILAEDNNLKSQEEDQAKKSSDHPEPRRPSNIDWRRMRKRKRIFGKQSPKSKKRTMDGEKTDHGQESFETAIWRELEACPLRRKVERWDLKPVISECGRILVPHGSVDIADRIKALKDKCHSRKDKICSENMLVDACVNSDDTKLQPESSIDPETTLDKQETMTSKSGGNHAQNFSHIDLEHSTLRQSHDDNCLLTLKPENTELLSKNEDTDAPPLETIQEHVDSPSTKRCTTKGFLLSKLKSVILRGKRKMDTLVSEEMTDSLQDTEPCLKKNNKVDSCFGRLESNDSITIVQDTSVKAVSVDPLFAFALGLTPIEKPDKQHKAEDQDSQRRKDTSETQEQTVLFKQSPILKRPLSFFTRRGRIKMLKKHQGISTECVKKKWWLHFQSPACFASEKPKYNECLSDSSVRKTVKEKDNSDCSPTDALNLLADLALSNDQVPPQPDPTLDPKPETSFKKCDPAKDVTSGEQVSVLHDLLRQPAARAIQPLECPSPSHHVEGSELVGLISKEHAYSFPPSSPLLLDLSGTSFQVSPLSGSTRLLHHHQTMYGDGIKTLQHSVRQEDSSEQIHRTPEYLKNHVVRRRTFRHSRSFTNKDGSIQITKQWKGNYDFNLDSKFTTDPKYRVVIRALHGPWDLSIQDTTEEVRLIVHMWIGLFYSRSTPRFFHLDTNCANPCAEGSGSLDMSSEMVSSPVQSEVEATSFSPSPSDTTDSKAIDLSKKHLNDTVMDQESGILNLSLRNSNAENANLAPQLYKKEIFLSSEQKGAIGTLNTTKSSMGLQKADTFQCGVKDIISETNSARTAYESKRNCTASQKVAGALMSLQENMESASIQLANHLTSLGHRNELHGCNNEKTDMKDGIKSSEATGMCSVQKQGMDLSKQTKTEKEAQTSKNSSDVAHTIEHDETESKDKDNCELTEKSYQEGNAELPPSSIHASSDLENEESSIICSGNLFEDEKHLSKEEAIAVPTCKVQNHNEDVDPCTVHEDEETEDIGKKHVLNEKNRLISAVEANRGVDDQSLPIMCDGSYSVTKDCFRDNHKAPLEEPAQEDNDKDVCHDFQLRKLCANSSALADTGSNSETCPQILPEKDYIGHKDSVKEKTENDSLAGLHDQPLPVCEGTDSSKDCVPTCDGQAPMEGNKKEDACHDLQSRKLCASSSAPTDKDSSLETCPQILPGKDSIGNDSVEGNSDNGSLTSLHHQPLSICESSHSSKDCITVCIAQAPAEQRPEADIDEDLSHALQLRNLCASSSALTDKDSSLKMCPEILSETDSIGHEDSAEENSENGSLGGLHDQLLSMCEDTDSSKDGDTKSNGQIPVEGQPIEEDKKEDACHDLQLRKLCASSSALTDKDSSLESCPQILPGKDSIGNDSVEGNSENGSLADLHDQPLSMCEDTDSSKDGDTKSNGQIPVEGQPIEEDKKEDACHDLQLRKLCASSSALTDKDSSLESCPQILPGKDSIGNDSVEGNSENGSLADLHDQPLSMCEDTDSSKDGDTKSNGQIPVEGQPIEEDKKEDACHDLQLRKLCASSSALTDKDSSLELCPQILPGKDSIGNDSVEGNSENGSLADLHDQPLSMCEDTDSSKDGDTKSNGQIPVEGQPIEEDKKEDACHDLQLRKLCASSSALTDKDSSLESCPQILPGMDSIGNDSVEGNSENGSLADLHDQSLSMCEDTDSSRDADTKSNGQIPVEGQPPEGDKKELACHDSQLLSANYTQLIDEHISKNVPQAKLEMEPILSEPGHSEDFICLEDMAHYQKASLYESGKLSCSLDGSAVDMSIPQINEGVETGSQNKVVANINLSSVDHNDQDTKLVQRGKNVESTIRQQFNHESNSPQCEAVIWRESEVALTEQTDLKTNKGSEKMHSQVVIPFIGIDLSGEDAAQPHYWDSENKLEEEAASISETVYPKTVVPTDVHSNSQMYSKETVHKMSANQPEVSGSETDDRCPTPTVDEEPYHYVTCGPSSSGSEACKNMTQQCFNTLIKDDVPLEPKHTSPINSDLCPDLELRTLRVLQSIDRFLTKSSHTDKRRQIKGSDLKHTLDQTGEVQETAVGQDCPPHQSFPSEYLQAFKPEMDPKTLSQTNLCHDPHSYSQRPIMAVRPSKSDEIGADCISKDGKVENSAMSKVSKNKPTKTSIFINAKPSSMLLEKKTIFKGKSARLNNVKQEASEVSTKTSWLSNVTDGNSDKGKFAGSCKLSMIPSFSLSVPPSESAKTSNVVDVNQSQPKTTGLVKTVRQITKASTKMGHKEHSNASTSAPDYKADSIIDELFLGPESSLACTVFNTSRKTSNCLLEQLSKRCLQDDPTRASIEQECLIFSDKMKQLLKRSKKGPVHQEDANDKFTLSRSSPLTVHFSILDEQEDSVEHFDTLALVGQKIKIDMSDRKDPAVATEEENTLLPQSKASGNPMEHAGVSGVTAECARLYAARMKDVCAAKPVPCRTKAGVDRGYPKANHFDFCDKMKREMDESFRSNLNSVVKKSCKMKYRFYILATSDDAFFEETKAQLENEGHTAVQPSEFFVAESGSSSLLIILRNEDIAEHVCEVPHLLQLKRSPGVQFAGIDEPDDVVNLTHQELFMRGGFVVFDRAALESLTICNMKKMAEIMQELSRMGKWRWMLHYRDSRRLKENARLSAEAKEKKHFLNWCQEVGILEVLPYHECDLMPRDQPDFVTCLVRLQVQNISARYPIFISDSPTDTSFGTNGILTMTVSSILTCSPSETFAV